MVAYSGVEVRLTCQLAGMALDGIFLSLFQQNVKRCCRFLVGTSRVAEHPSLHISALFMGPIESPNAYSLRHLPGVETKPPLAGSALGSPKSKFNHAVVTSSLNPVHLVPFNHRTHLRFYKTS